MPEGDTIHHAARCIRPVLEGRIPDLIEAPQRRHGADRWPERLAGRAVTAIDVHGKHLFLRFEGDLVLHSHLRMSGAWRVYSGGQRWRRSPRRAWLVLRSGEHAVVQFDGPVLELMSESRSRFDQRIAGLGQDILAEQFDGQQVLARLRADDPTRGIGDALLDQRIVAGIGNVWKAEACFAARLDPWRAASTVPDEQLLELLRFARKRMTVSARDGVMKRPREVYGRSSERCRRCAERIRSRGQGDDNRTTYWCPGCQV